MKINIFRLWLIIVFFIQFLNVNQANAVPPPDFIIQIASQLWSFFAIWVAIMSWLYATSYQFIKWYFINHKKKFLFISIFSILLISFIWAYSYDIIYQEKEQIKQNNEWLKEVKNNELQDNKSLDTKIISVNEKNTLLNVEDKSVDIKVNTKNEEIKEDIWIVFIKKYYSYIENHDFSNAYELSKKQVSLNTFKSWYKNTTKIEVLDILKIDQEKYSLELILEEKNIKNHYNVLITLLYLDNTPVQIKNSIVTAKDNIKNTNEITPIINNSKAVWWPQTNDIYNFYENNKEIPLSITNAELNEKINNNLDNYIILDARENLEYDIWYIPWSTHIRFADLQAGRWIELPKDKYIYVLCWSWMRGKEVAEYLKKQKLVVQYLEKWADSWVSSWWKWEWEIKFSKAYWKENQKLVFSTNQVKEKITEWVILIDSREPIKYNTKHIDWAINIPIMYTPTSEIWQAFSQIPKWSSVIIICDAYINCFDAKITWIELEQKGIIFLGRYNKPWEF